jgi:putative transposase
MRYADGGGLTAEGRARREAVRLQAAKLFDQDIPTGQIVYRLRVSANSVRVWRRRWRTAGIAALASRGPGGASCRLDHTQLQWLAAELDAGPAVHGYTDDQRWTLARVATLIWHRYRVRYTVRGVSYLLHRIGFTPQVPAHRAVERDERAITTWLTETWPAAKHPRRPRTRSSASRTRPAKA